MSVLHFKDKLTPQILKDDLAPFLSALASIQQIVNEMKGVKNADEIEVAYIGEDPILTAVDAAAESAAYLEQAIEELKDVEERTRENLSILYRARAIEASDIYDIVILAPGPNLVETVNVVRKLTGQRYSEARQLVLSSNSLVLSRVDSKTAEDAKRMLEDVGARVALIKPYEEKSDTDFESYSSSGYSEAYEVGS